MAISNEYEKFYSYEDEEVVMEDRGVIMYEVSYSKCEKELSRK